jgi:FlaA1/EpsC-like NDP-sugar epimerase
METTPCEAIKNNVTGTRLLAEAAERHGVERFILISTDKAVNPSSVMGASKRLAELVIRARAAASTTSFAAVRFGNVLGSNGSVIPTFLEQIRRGGPVTVTHPDVKRFFMLTSEAVQLVLHAAAQATHNATYVLEMGDQVRVLDMARHLIRLSGLVPDRDIAIEFTGLRPGEKLYEELVGDGEAVAPSPIDKIQQLTENTPPSDVTMLQIEAIEAHAAANDAHGVLALLDELFPTRAGVSAQASAVEGVRAVRHLPAGDAAPACVVCRVGRMRRWRPRAASQPAAAASGRGGLFACDECGWLGWQAPAALAGSRALAGANDLKGAAGVPVPFVPYRGSSPRSPN